MAFKQNTAISQVIAILSAILGYIAFQKAFPATGILCSCLSLIAAIPPMRRHTTRAIPVSADCLPSQVDRHRLLALLDLTPTPMILREDEVRFIAVNKAARSLFQTDDLISHPRHLTKAFDKTEEGKQFFLNGSYYRLILSDIASDGSILQRLGVLCDISAERHAAETAAARDLFQVINHELMNSLTPITSLSQTALDLLDSENPADIEKIRSALNRVANRSGRLLRFAENYRRLSKLPPPSPAPTEPRAWLEDVTEIAKAHWQNVDISTDFTSLPPTLTIDQEQLTQALLNLVANACEAALSGTKRASVLIGAHCLGTKCEISVEDNGPGISSELQSKIYLPFFTTKPNGSGIGLSLAQQIVAGHGAELRLDQSKIWKGSRFSFML